jgi:hypothetical protein
MPYFERQLRHGKVVKWLQAFDHQTWIAARRTISYPLAP